MRGRCMLILIWLVRKYKKTREGSNSADESLWSFYIYIRCEMTPNSVGGEQQISISEAFLNLILK